MSLAIIVAETEIVINVIFPNTGLSIGQVLIEAAFLSIASSVRSLARARDFPSTRAEYPHQV